MFVWFDINFCLDYKWHVNWWAVRYILRPWRPPLGLMTLFSGWSTNYIVPWGTNGEDFKPCNWGYWQHQRDHFIVWVSLFLSPRLFLSSERQQHQSWRRFCGARLMKCWVTPAVQHGVKVTALFSWSLLNDPIKPYHCCAFFNWHSTPEIRSELQVGLTNVEKWKCYLQEVAFIV